MTAGGWLARSVLETSTRLIGHNSDAPRRYAMHSPRARGCVFNKQEAVNTVRRFKDLYVDLTEHFLMVLGGGLANTLIATRTPIG